jgi:hypothetical protein
MWLSKTKPRGCKNTEYINNKQWDKAN